MPGENGFGLIPFVQETQATVIFTTAYDQYALKAIKANAIDYLLKPIDIDELKAAVEKAAKYIRFNERERSERLGNLASELSSRQAIQKITVPNGQGYRMMNVDDITHIDADSNYSIFYLASEERIVVSRVLKDYEEILPEDRFMRIHKSSIVNLSHIKEYHSKNGLQVCLDNGVIIPVSRRRAPDFLERIKKFSPRRYET